MFDELTEKRVHQLFQDKRKVDTTLAPTFDGTWNAAVVRMQQRRIIRFRLRLAAAAIVVMAIVTTMMVHEHRSKQRMIEIVNNMSWESPTRSLNRFPGIPLSIYGQKQGPQKTWIEYTNYSSWEAPTQSLLSYIEQ